MFRVSNPSTYEQSKRLWLKLTDELNAMSGAIKDCRGWKDSLKKIIKYNDMKHLIALERKRKKLILGKSKNLLQTHASQCSILVSDDDTTSTTEITSFPDKKLPTRSVPVQISAPKLLSLLKVLNKSDEPIILEIVPVPMKKLPSQSVPVQIPILVPKIISLSKVPSEYGQNGPRRSCRNPCEADSMFIFDNTRVAGKEFKIVQLIDICIGLKVITILNFLSLKFKIIYRFF